MNRRQFVLGFTGAMALAGTASSGHAECSEMGAVEFVEGVYQRQAELLAALAPPDDKELLAPFSRRMRKAMQASRRKQPDPPPGPVLHAFFGWGVLQRTAIKTEKATLMAGRDEGPATVRVDFRHHHEIHQSFVRAVREKEIWRIADISYDSGRSLAEHHRRIAEHRATSRSVKRFESTTSAPSLRAKRSNPEAKKQELDCFVARAPRNDGVSDIVLLESPVPIQ